jgi:hypothetical protein
MWLYRTTTSERINLDGVSRIVERPGVLELHFENGTFRNITIPEEIVKIENVLASVTVA